MRNLQQYTCPSCGQIGAHGATSPAPLCHRCSYKVIMQKSHSGKIISLAECREEKEIEGRKRIFDRLLEFARKLP